MTDLTMTAKHMAIIGCGDSVEEAGKDHNAKLVDLLDHCHQVKLRLSVKNLLFKVSEVRFHGHIPSAVGLKADPEEVRAMLDMLAPSDVKGMQRLIGFVTYLTAPTVLRRMRAVDETHRQGHSLALAAEARCSCQGDETACDNKAGAAILIWIKTRHSAG